MFVARVRGCDTDSRTWQTTQKNVMVECDHLDPGVTLQDSHRCQERTSDRSRVGGRVGRDTVRHEGTPPRPNKETERMRDHKRFEICQLCLVRNEDLQFLTERLKRISISSEPTARQELGGMDLPS